MSYIHELLLKRHSIRRYTDEPLTPEQVQMILEAALLAPTSKNSRSWQFVVVEDQSMLERLAELKPAYGASIAKCKMAVVVCGDPTKSDPWVEDASIAAEFMQLQAEDLGLGSCWVQVRGRFTADDIPSEEYVQQLLGIPDVYPVLCVMTFGHKDEQRKPVDPSKLLWEKVHVGAWNPSQE